MSLSEQKLLEKVEKLLWTLKQVEHKKDNPLEIRIQGKRPETGGISVVYFRKIRDLRDAKYILQCILFGRPHDDIDNFVERCRKKVVNGYCNSIKVSGYDEEKDALDYEIEFGDQKQMLMFLQTGLFSIENPDHNKYLLVDIFDR